MVRTGKRESSISTTYFAIVPMKLSLILSIGLLFSAMGEKNSKEFDFVSCKNEAPNTLISNDCFKKEDNRLFDINSRYYKRILRLHQDNPLVVSKLKEAREAFIEEKDAYCSAQYEIWTEGSIRNIMYLECSHLLIKQDTYFLWETYLRRMDYGNRDPEFPNPNSN